MSTGGWIVMCLSVSFVVTLTAWCYWRVLHLPPPEQDEQL